MVIKEFMNIKREQLRLERENKLLLNRIAFELREIKSLIDLSVSNSVHSKGVRGRDKNK